MKAAPARQSQSDDRPVEGKGRGRAKARKTMQATDFARATFKS